MDSADGCITAPGSVCLATELGPAEAAAVVTQVISAPSSTIESRAGLPGAPAMSVVMSGSIGSQPVVAVVDAHRLTPVGVSPARFSAGSTISVAGSDT